MKKTILIVFAAAVALSVSLVTVRAADEPMPSVGQMAPTFSLPSQDGNQVSLDSFRGKWVVLYFYPKDMTPGLHDRGAQLPARPGASTTRRTPSLWA